MASDNPSIPYDQETLRLKEALRAAEWQIEQQNKAFDTIERKAVQLITLYLLIIVFLIQSDILNKAFENLTTNLVFIFFIFLTPALICPIILRPRPSEKANYNSIHFLQGPKDFNQMMQDLLKNYIERCDNNVKALKKKAKYYKISVLWGFIVLYIVYAAVHIFIDNIKT